MLTKMIFAAYFMYLRSVPFFVALVLAYLFSQISENAVGWWLSYWTDHAGSENAISLGAFMGVFFAVGMARVRKMKLNNIGKIIPPSFLIFLLYLSELKHL